MNLIIDKIRQRVISDMNRHIKFVLNDNGDPGYTEIDVEKCNEIISSYIQHISLCKYGDEQAAMLLVKDTVLKINELNDETGLIETEQRENLAEIIIIGAADIGVGNGKDDLTEEWRDW